MSRPGKIALTYAVFALLWIFGSDRLLTSVVNDPVVLGWAGTFKGIAFVLVTSLLLYLLLRVWRGSLSTRHAPIPRVSMTRLIGLFTGLALIVPLLGFSIYQVYRPQVREDALADLGAIAALKSDQIEAWLAQRLATATVLAKDTELAQNVTLLIRNPSDEQIRQRIQTRLNAVREVYGYDMLLLDITGKNLLEAGHHDQLAVGLKPLLTIALQNGQVQRSELYRGPSGAIHLDYLVPLPPVGSSTRAVILVHTPVEQFLFPLIQRWPTTSASAETMLVRREGDKVLYLNELRHMRNTALTLTAPLNNGTSPSAMAVRSGKARYMDTTDIRGVQVLAASQPVAGTPWYVVAKIDRAEVLAPLMLLALWVSIVTLAAVVALAGVILLLWRQQQRAYALELRTQTTERDRLLKLFFDLPFVGMSMTSPVTKRWIHVNDHLCNMLGYTREEMMDLTWAQLTHPDDLTADVVEFERVLKGEIDGYQMDKRFLNKDGTIIDTTLNVKAVRYQDGNVEWFVATIQDMTARKRAEAAQRTLNDRISSMLESMLEGFVALDTDWRYLYVNRQAASMLGRDQKSLIGKHIWEEFPEGVGQPFAQAYQRVMAQQTPEQIEEYFAPWNRWYENRIYPTPEGISIYFQDITERKLMEATLRDSEARFRAIIETGPECVKMVGPDGRLKFMNQAGLDMIEADSLEQMQGHSVLEIITPDHQKAFQRLTNRVLHGERGKLEFEIVGLKGTRRFLETHAVALRASEGEPYSLLGITRDITERKIMEDQLRQQLAELLRWQETMLGREDRVRELKREINALLASHGQAPRYPSQAGI